MNTMARRFIFSSFFFWLAIGGFALYCIFFHPFEKKLRFGIDLVGGSYITLGVETDKAIEAELSEKMQRLPERLKKAKIKLLSRELITNNAFFTNKELAAQSKDLPRNEMVLTFETPDAARAVAALMRNEDPQLAVDASGVTVKAHIKEQVAQELADEAVKTNFNIYDFSNTLLPSGLTL